MSVFSDALGVQDGIHDAFFGEAFTISPAAENPTDVNARRSRPTAVPFTGIWDEDHEKVFAHNDAGHRDSATRRLSPNRHTVDYQVAALPFAVARGFIVTRVADGSLHAVSDVIQDGLTRAVMVLTAATKAPS